MDIAECISNNAMFVKGFHIDLKRTFVVKFRWQGNKVDHWLLACVNFT